MHNNVYLGISKNVAFVKVFICSVQNYIRIDGYLLGRSTGVLPHPPTALH